MVAGASCASVVSATALREHRPESITVVLDDNYPPYIFRDAQGELAGQLKDTWELWSKKTGIRVDLQAMDWGLAKETMAKGKADVIDTIFRTAEREKRLDFSNPYATIDVAVYFQRDLSGIADVRTLRGFTVGVKEGDACIDWLTERNVTSFQRYPSYQAMIDAAAKREVLVFCIDLPPAQYFLGKRKLLDQFRRTPALFSGHFHWAVAKGNIVLADIIQDGFDKITEEERSELKQRWHGYALNDSELAEAFYILMRVLLAIVAIGVAMLVWNWTLRQQVRRKTRSLTSALDALAAGEERFRTIFDNVNDAIFIHGLPDGRILLVNQRMREMYGIGERDVTTIEFNECCEGSPPFDFPHAKIRIERAVAGEPQMFEWLARRGNGELFWVEVSVRKAYFEGADRVLVVARDISERKAALSRLEFLAHHDPLTHLPNQLRIRDLVGRGIEDAGRSGKKLALIVSDLDQFKTINDSLGHITGDRFLCEVASRLSDCVQNQGTVGRQSGDEFIILVRDADELTTIEITLRLHEIASRPVVIDGQELAVTLSTGIAVYPDNGADFDVLRKKADTAMHYAKASGRNAYRFFTDEMNAAAVEHVAVTTGLRRALERGEFVLHYQPQVDIRSRKTVGVEALIRWNHPERGLLMPVSFIGIAESSGLIVSMGSWVLREACRQASVWQRAGRPLQVAVNLSALQFRVGDLEQIVEDALAESCLDPHLLELELTESVLLNITDDVLTTVHKLREIGVQLSIDDFGTGYSSLTYIKRLAVTTLKIDRTFILDLHDNPESAAIASAIIQMAHSLGLTTVAEGVEDDRTLAILRRWNCDIAQGYLFGRPVPAEALEVDDAH